MRRLAAVSLAAVSLAAVMACGGSAPPPTTTSACGAAPSPAPTGDTAWRAGVDIELLRRYPAQHPETFAGTWLDDARRKAVLAFTDDPAPHLARLRRQAKNPDSIDVVRHELSRHQLTTRADQISRSKDALEKEGITLTSVAVDDRTNRIVIGVARSNTAHAEFLCKLYGRQIIVQSEALPTPPRAEPS